MEQNNNKAVEWYQKAAAQGHAMAEGKMGFFYFWGGGGVRVDRSKAIAMWVRAAEHGDVASMTELGEYYDGTYEEDGIGLPEDQPKAIEWFLKGAAMDDEVSQLRVCYHFGLVNTIRQCKEVTQPKAMLTLGEWYYIGTGGLTKDESKAFQWFLSAARMGLLSAHWSVYQFYYHGYGVKRDEKEGLKWLRRAAEAGDIRSQTEMGIIHMEGREGVLEADGKEAMKWYHMAAEQGNPYAQCDYGFLCETIDHDFKSALEWWQKAAAQGNSLAMWNLHLCYQQGKGVKPNGDIANQWLIRSALAGHKDAQQDLSDLYVSSSSGPMATYDVKEINDWIMEYYPH